MAVSDIRNDSPDVLTCRVVEIATGVFLVCGGEREGVIGVWGRGAGGWGGKEGLGMGR